MAAKTEKPHLLAIPFPALGNILPLLDLAHELSTRGISITVAVSAGNLPRIQPLLSSSHDSLLLLPIPLTLLSADSPERAEDLPPSLFFSLSDTLAELHEPLLLWSRAHHSPPTALLSDFLLPWSHRLASDLSIPHYVFCPFSALSVSIAQFFHHRQGIIESEAGPESEAEISLADLPRSPSYPHRHISPLIAASPSEFVSAAAKSRGFIFNSFSALELDILRRISAARVWAIGPIPHHLPRFPGHSSVPAADINKWLDSCLDCSVVYISFGPRAVLNPPQVVAVATALEVSKVRFVWCVKGPEAEKGLGCEMPEWIKAAAATGPGRKGIVVEGWVAQAAVLRHRAVGAFVTHCGWNSVLEAVVAGVPMVTWPMGADQYVNSRLVAEAGLGIEVCDGGETVPDAVELAARLVEAVGDWGGNGREQPTEMRRIAADAVEEGGSSAADMDALVAELRSVSVNVLESA